MRCEICGGPLGLLERLRGAKHHKRCARPQAVPPTQGVPVTKTPGQSGCPDRIFAELAAIDSDRERAYEQAMRAIEQGEFACIENAKSPVPLESGENCCFVMNDCFLAYFYPSRVGKGTISTLRGDDVPRYDGILAKDYGQLIITDRRVVFSGATRSEAISLRQVADCFVKDDTLYVWVRGGKRRAHFFSLGEDWANKACVAILKLASFVQGREV